MKQTIRLRENEHRRMIAESVRRVLNETDNNSFEDDFPIFSKYEDNLIECNNQIRDYAQLMQKSPSAYERKLGDNIEYHAGFIEAYACQPYEDNLVVFTPK